MGEQEQRPGGWIDGIGWVALAPDLSVSDRTAGPYGSQRSPVEHSRLYWWLPAVVTCWADGTIPAPPAPVDGGTPQAEGERCADRGYDDYHSNVDDVPAPPAAPVPPEADERRALDELRRLADATEGSHRNGDGVAIRTVPEADVERAYAFLAARPASSPSVDEPAELAHLRRWKAEAITVIRDWERVHVALGSPGRIGESKAAASLAEVERRAAAAPGGEA